MVAFNTIYNCDDPIFYNDRNSYDSTGVFAYNLAYTTTSHGVGGDISGTGQGMSCTGNIFGGSTIGLTDPGITSGDAQFSPVGEISKPSSTGVAADAAGSTYSSVVIKDIDGNSRNTTMDIGAHEYPRGKVLLAPPRGLILLVVFQFGGRSG